nr:calumenin-B [Ipomoea batatas]
MGKASVIVYITIAVLLLLLISHSPDKGNKPHRHRRLKLRSNFTFADGHLHHDRIPFDPIVADIERKREDKEWEKMYIETHHPELKSHDAEHAPAQEAQPEWEDFIDAEDYLNDEEKFNVTNRLVLLFPKIDIDPPDGFVSERELTHWNLEQSRKDVLHRTEREMEAHDKNRDGLVSFAEYEPPTWVQKSEPNSVGYDMGWWKEEHFNASDMDGDGQLNITEFNDFLHPADTTNPKLLLWLCKEEIRERDSDKDGKVNFNEFFHGLFDLVRNYDEEGHNTSHHSDDSGSTPARKLFDELDKDGDGYLSDVELLPIIEKLHPSERYYAKQQADYIIQQADSDKDGRLTLSEMIDSPYVFYSAIFNEDEESDYDEYHDEFR